MELIFPFIASESFLKYHHSVILVALCKCVSVFVFVGSDFGYFVRDQMYPQANENLKSHMLWKQLKHIDNILIRI